ncbi:hypothetical protein TPHA_0E03750 [Tetrapisispora phaffii CBS 4417]|uniref:HTH La-type RNA-binding domain-containing protein n=1 Tax=Tetrapisispora phaffii (strain ATCC 24235 / CBS 4417 / NBRC 1672 / NRRL Y-8282 / UCD 70-5) TaxID=1071381 RepID=G8BU86_TETPH|nr:hypothetical protein TPHA_0E03750 [Tetrapisispora phaffii CBS 4417]CCE63464.1 hypothetical protein TPHA_0E03750 [Tetrapisispora phaffii CBS 4417]
MSDSKEDIENVVKSEVEKEDSQIPIQESKSFILAPKPSQSPWKNGEVDGTNIPEQVISIEHTQSKSVGKYKKKHRGKKSNSVIKINSNTKWEAIQPVIVVADEVGNKTSNSNNSNSNNGKKSSRRRSKKKKPSTTDEGKDKESSKQNEDQQHSANGNKSNANMKQTSSKKNNNRKKTNKKKHQDSSNVNKKSEPDSKSYKDTESKKHNNNHNRNLYHGDHQNTDQRTYYSLKPIIDSVNAVAHQIEYYLSKENLEKDTYLMPKLSKDGYISMYPLSKFFRLVNLSFGGNISILLAALREIVVNENATITVSSGAFLDLNIEDSENILRQFFLRGKDWESYKGDIVNNKEESSYIIEKELSGNDLDQYMIFNVKGSNHRRSVDANHEGKENANATNTEEPKAEPEMETEKEDVN